MANHRRLLALLVLPILMPALLALASCSGSGAQDRSPEQTLAAAKKQLDATTGVHLTLSTDGLPDGVDGVLRAEGVGTHAPAFDGSLKVSAGGIEPVVPVVAVDNAVYARLPFMTRFVKVDPGDYGAPDPADLMDSRHGLSSLLTHAQHTERGKAVRDGKQVMTEYTGTVPGTVVATIIPSASADRAFDASFTIDAQNRLEKAVLTGPFYPHAGDVTYTIVLDRYGTTKHVTAP